LNTGLLYYHPLVLVLALDTTTRGGSCALARDGVVLDERSTESAEYAARLPGDLMALLDRTGVALAEVDAFAVATGPGRLLACASASRRCKGWRLPRPGR
jgi:hypothetical protein